MSDSSRLPVVSLVGHAPAWTVEGARLAGRPRTRPGPAAPRVEHIGGTAIEDMAAEDVLSLRPSVAGPAAAETAFTGPVQSPGFTLHHYRQGHVPASRDDDPAGRQKATAAPPSAL
jgi:dephospho-CoA kinase